MDKRTRAGSGTKDKGGLTKLSQGIVLSSSVWQGRLSQSNIEGGFMLVGVWDSIWSTIAATRKCEFEGLLS